MIHSLIPLDPQWKNLITTNVCLKNKNWFNTGGPAQYFAQPRSPQEFQHALEFAWLYNLAIFVLGHGANILISDQGFTGLLIQPHMTNIHHYQVDESNALVTAGAGVSMHDLIEYCLQNNLIGLEEFSGIPGTVGGSVYINLHYFEFLLAQFLHQATIINRTTGKLEIVPPAWFEFGYDHSKLVHEEYYLLDATFNVKKVSEIQAAFARGRRTEIIRHRQRRYPTKNTCGSFFRNFFEHEVTLINNGKKMIYVAYYLDKLGIKGQLQVGDAIVSYQHANMIVNQGSATSTDIITLARTIQKMAHEEFGIIPQPECRLVGFDSYPLL